MGRSSSQPLAADTTGWRRPPPSPGRPHHAPFTPSCLSPLSSHSQMRPRFAGSTGGGLPLALPRGGTGSTAINFVEHGQENDAPVHSHRSM